MNNPTYINISITHIAQVVKTVTATKFRHEPFQDFYEVFEEIGRGGGKMKAKISDWQLFNSSRSSTKSWRKVNPSQSVLGCYLSVLVSSCPGVLVSWSQPVLILYGQVMARLGPAWITIRSGGG